MKLEAIEHIPDSAYSYAVDTDKLVIRIRCAKNDIYKCTLYYGDRVCMRQPIIVHELPMELIASDALFDYFEVYFDCSYTRVCYYFKLDDGIKQLYYYGGEFSDAPHEDRTLYFQLPFIRREEIVTTPEWAEKSIMYQIFPDSFATSNRQIDCKSKAVLNIFNEKSSSLNGGTLKGITENVDYLADLGINCLYLNPIFTAEQWHKYDTIDYFSVDPCFGTNEDLKQLVKVCHENNIKVLLDGVFNHTGWKFFAFKDILLNGENSKYKDWYYDLEFPVSYKGMPNYQCFAYVKEMPKLNTSNPEVIDYFLKVARYWIEEADIDGWRLDVANEIDHDFWRSFRKEVKTVKKDAFLVAEIWEDAQDWLQGDQFDSAMNYKFASICTEYFAEKKINVEEFDYKINSIIMRYKHPITFSQMNLLDSHDVVRFLSRCKGDIKIFKLAVLFQMMFVGVPSIFYGDEKALMGMEEKEYRRPMNWKDNELSSGLTQYYKKLISIRKEYMDQMLGKYKTLLADNERNIYVFSREADGKKIVVAINNSNSNQEIAVEIPDGVNTVYDVLNNRNYKIELGQALVSLESKNGAILDIV